MFPITRKQFRAWIDNDPAGIVKFPNVIAQAVSDITGKKVTIYLGDIWVDDDNLFKPAPIWVGRISNMIHWKMRCPLPEQLPKTTFKKVLVLTKTY